jgi:hypothetical protein
MLFWVGLVIALAGVLMVGVERLLRRLGIQPERPQDLSGGLRDLLNRVEDWQQDHARRRNGIGPK